MKDMQILNLSFKLYNELKEQLLTDVTEEYHGALSLGFINYAYESFIRADGENKSLDEHYIDLKNSSLLLLKEKTLDEKFLDFGHETNSIALQQVNKFLLNLEKSSKHIGYFQCKLIIQLAIYFLEKGDSVYLYSRRTHFYFILYTLERISPFAGGYINSIRKKYDIPRPLNWCSES